MDCTCNGDRASFDPDQLFGAQGILRKHTAGSALVKVGATKVLAGVQLQVRFMRRVPQASLAWQVWPFL